MPFDGTATKTMTLVELRNALMSPLPEGFVWDFRHCDHCAIGLSALLTGGNRRAGLRGYMFDWVPETAPALMDDWEFCSIFRAWIGDPEGVTPKIVAERIDGYLLRISAAPLR